MCKTLIPIASLLVGIALAADVDALDYDLKWRFDTPMGETQFPPWAEPDFLTYFASTGELRYDVAPENTGEWSPPDIVSASGAFLVDTPLEPVPLDGPVPFEWFAPFSPSPPQFEQDLLIAGATVSGSNGLRIRYDSYLFIMDYDVNDPRVLGQWGLDAVPTSHSFGRVLSSGLDEAFLLNDLYTSGGRVLLRFVVPEPSAVATMLLAMVGFAAIGFAHFRCSRSATQLVGRLK